MAIEARDIPNPVDKPSLTVVPTIVRKSPVEIAQRIPNALSGLKQQLDQVQQAARLFYRSAEQLVVPHIQETVLLDNPRYHPPSFDAEVQESMSDGNHVLVLEADHAAHNAAFLPVEEFAEIAETVNQVLPDSEKITGARILLAYNIENGQNEEMSSFFKMGKPIFARFGVEPLYVVRPKDRRAMTREEYGERVAYQREELGKVAERHQAIIVLPEGTVKAGRQKEGGAPGERNGMVQFIHKSLGSIVEVLEEHGKVPLFIPMGTSGETSLYDPITEKVPGSAKRKALAAKLIPGVRYFQQPSMVGVVGHPEPFEKLVQYLGIDGKIPNGALEQYFGELTYNLVHPNERGTVYANPTLLDKVPGPKVKYEAIMASPEAARGRLVDIFLQE